MPEMGPMVTPAQGNWNNWNSRWGFRNPIYVYTTPTQACKPVYDNQTTIDALNNILANCETLKTQSSIKCDGAFISAVEKELLHQLSIAKLVGRDCTNTGINGYRTTNLRVNSNA